MPDLFNFGPTTFQAMGKLIDAQLAELEKLAERVIVSAHGQPSYAVVSLTNPGAPALRLSLANDTIAYGFCKGEIMFGGRESCLRTVREINGLQPPHVEELPVFVFIGRRRKYLHTLLYNLRELDAEATMLSHHFAN